MGCGIRPACRANSFCGAGRPQPSLRDSRPFGVQPSVETLGYSRLSLRDSKNYEAWSYCSCRMSAFEASVLAPKAQRFQRLARIDAIVKRNNRVFKLLVGLVAF